MVRKGKKKEEEKKFKVGRHIAVGYFFIFFIWHDDRRTKSVSQSSLKVKWHGTIWWWGRRGALPYVFFCGGILSIKFSTQLTAVEEKKLCEWRVTCNTILIALPYSFFSLHCLLTGDKNSIFKSSKKKQNNNFWMAYKGELRHQNKHQLSERVNIIVKFIE